MRVALINPRFRLPIDTRTTAHLGLAYLGAVSERRGDEVRIFDADIEEQPMDEFIREFRPHVVGITANTPQVKQAWRHAAQIKAIHDVPIVIGGPHPSVAAEDLDFESAGQTGIDLVVRGEGEEAWTEICDRLESFLRDQEGYSTRTLMDPGKRLWDDIQGITFQTSDGELHRNPDRPAIADLDSLPWPAYHLFKMHKYTNLQPATDHIDGARSFSIMTSRGCPYRCSYCSQSIFKYRWRGRSPEGVAAEWQHLVRELGATEIGVLDDSFNIDRKRVHALCDLLVSGGLQHVPWIMINGIRANLADEETLGRMKSAGCKRTAFGVESGNQVVLNGIDKKLDLAEVCAAFRAARKVGMETIGFFMIGLPGDTEATMDETIRLACELDPVVANFSMTTPFPGTTLYEQITEAERQGRGRLLITDWDNFIFLEGRARYELDGLTAELQERKWKEAYRRFYLRPKRVLQTLLRKSTWLQLPRTVRMAFRMVWATK